MNIARLLATAALLVAAIAPAEAASKCKPIAPARITEMWEHYRTQPTASAPARQGDFQCVSIDAAYQVVCRTRSSHPAHPSIVIRTVVQKGKAVSVRTEADTAANCDAFRRLMDEYDQLTQDTLGGL